MLSATSYLPAQIPAGDLSSRPCVQHNSNAWRWANVSMGASLAPHLAGVQVPNPKGSFKDLGT